LTVRVLSRFPGRKPLTHCSISGADRFQRALLRIRGSRMLEVRVLSCEGTVPTWTVPEQKLQLMDGKPPASPSGDAQPAG
jgi:hypothetical protein